MTTISLLKTHHAQKRNQENNRKMTSCFAGAQAWKKTSGLLIYCPLHYFVLFDTSFQVLSILSGLEPIITTSLRMLQASRCRVPVHLLILFLLAPRFPIPLKLFSSDQDHDMSDGHNYRCMTSLGLHLNSFSWPSKSLCLSMCSLNSCGWSQGCIQSSRGQLPRHVTALGLF